MPNTSEAITANATRRTSQHKRTGYVVFIFIMRRPHHAQSSREYTGFPCECRGVFFDGPCRRRKRGRYLLAPFSELPPLQDDEVYLHDLTGMKMVSATGAEIGTVTTFYELPQGIMLDVSTSRGSVLIPYRPEIIVRTELETRTIVMDDKLGLLDDASGSDDASGFIE